MFTEIELDRLIETELVGKKNMLTATQELRTAALRLAFGDTDILPEFDEEDDRDLLNWWI
jgi:hypothetical protein